MSSAHPTPQTRSRLACARSCSIPRPPGLDPYQGHRLVEIGCIELINRFPTGKTFHSYLNPERDMPAEAFAVHGLSAEFLQDKPLFATIAAGPGRFLGDAPLVTTTRCSTSASSMRSSSAPVRRRSDASGSSTPCCWRGADIPAHRIGSTTCARRFGVDNSRRTKHGALLDAELLAEVYLELIGCRQATLGLIDTGVTASGARTRVAVMQVRAIALPTRLTDDELVAHAAFIATLGEGAIWREYLTQPG